MNYVDKWRFAYEAYTADGGFFDGGYIDRYPRESDEKYEARKKIAVYANLFAAKVSRYVGYLFKRQPVRASNNPMIRRIFDDADRRGNSIDVFMSNFAKEAKVRGAGLVLADMPKKTPETLKEQMQTRAVPYFVSIAPENLTEYKIDEEGDFEYVAFSDTLDLSAPGEKKIVEITRRYDRTGWQVIQEGDIVESGKHNLGVCPVLIFSETGEFPAVGEFTQIADLAKRHYNLRSELDEILRSQTFSILTLNADNPSDVTLKLATDNAIVYGKDMKAPSFIAPDAGPASTYQEEIAAVEALIDRIAYDVTTNKAQESGIALDIKFQGLNGSLSNFAMRLEDFEARLFDVACRYLGVRNDVTVSYPKTFNIVDVEKEIAVLESVKQLGYSIPTYERLKLQQIVSNDLHGVDVEDMQKIQAEIEDGLKEAE